MIENEILCFYNLRVSKGNYVKAVNSIEETIIEKDEEKENYKK